MDFEPSDAARRYSDLLHEFLVTRVLPAEAEYDAHRAAGGPADHTVPPVVEELKTEARKLGLWNLFLPAVSGLSNVDYAPLAEISGWSVDILPEAINCARTGHRQHGDAASVRHAAAAGRVAGAAAGRPDPFRVRHDRAGRRQQRRDQHQLRHPPRG